MYVRWQVLQVVAGGFARAVGPLNAAATTAWPRSGAWHFAHATAVWPPEKNAACRGWTNVAAALNDEG